MKNVKFIALLFLTCLTFACDSNSSVTSNRDNGGIISSDSTQPEVVTQQIDIALTSILEERQDLGLGNIDYNYRVSIDRNAEYIIVSFLSTPYTEDPPSIENYAVLRESDNTIVHVHLH